MSKLGLSPPERPHASFQDVLVAVSRKRYSELIGPGVFDAVVSSDDTMFLMDAEVSAAIAELAGPGYVAEVRAHAPARIGDVVATSAGAMPARHVLHAVTVDWSTAARPTERTIRQLARELFARCESLDVESVLVPLIGSGWAPLKEEESAAILIEVLMQHLANRSALKHVAISIPDAAAYDACFETLPKRLPGFPVRSRISLMFSSAPASAALETGMNATAILRPGSPPEAGPGEAPSRTAGVPAATTVANRLPRTGLGDIWRRFLSLRKTRRPRVPPEPPVLGDTGDDTWVLERLVAARSRGPARRVAARSESDESPLGSDYGRPVLARRYVLLEELGRGGFGVVRLSWDLVLRRVVAIKQLRSNTALTEGLKREATIALDLAHEGIVRTHHFEPASDDAGAFIVMEYVPWPTAERWLANGGDQLPPSRVVAELGMRVCDALDYAHARQVLHLDLKPANLFVDVSAERVKLADFGLARVSSPTGRVLPEVPSGTPAYMAPEQKLHGSRLTPATDLYQLAATLWDLLVGHVPVAGESPPHGIDQARRRVLDAIRPALAPAFEARPGKATEFRELLAAAL